jgi:hypothetical protein
MIIIIIGLPASGKTTYFKNNKKLFKDYIFHDDFISNFFNGELINDINSGNNVCICDPRLCNIQIFNKYINIIKDNKIKLLLFENNKEKCLINAKSRNKKVYKTIELLSEIYDINNYKNYDYDIIQVY